MNAHVIAYRYALLLEAVRRDHRDGYLRHEASVPAPGTGRHLVALARNAWQLESYRHGK